MAKEFLQKQVQRCVVKSKSAQKGAVELNMEIRMREENTDFINILSEMNGINSAVLVSYNGVYMGLERYERISDTIPASDQPHRLSPVGKGR